MPAPFPHEARSKTISPSTIAEQVHGHYCWLARWSDELERQDDHIDMKKLGQLAYGKASHCHHFASLTENLTPELIAAIESRFYREGREWPSREAQAADIAGIRTAAVALCEFVTNQMPEASVFSKRVRDPDGMEREEPIELPKPHPVIDYVRKLRDEFEG